MPAAPGSVKVAAGRTFLACAITAVAAWVLRGYLWPVLSNVEVDALRAMLDPELFRRDFAVQETLHFSPRFYYNQLILLPTRAGLPLAWTFAVEHVAFLVTLVAGLRALGRTLGLGETALAVLLLWLLTVSVGTLGGVYFYTHAPVPAVWAGAGVVWGAAWAWRGRWTAAFAGFGAAALLQFLVGFYAGLVAVVVLLAARRGRDLLRAWPWVLALAAVYGPMRLSGGTGTDALADAEFVRVYAQLRLPHHLVPSTWGWAPWLQAGLFSAGAWLLLERTHRLRPAYERGLAAAAVLLPAAALLVNYLGVEVWPVAFVAKLQPARLTPLTQGLLLLLLATRVQALAQRRDWFGVVLLAAIPFTALPGLLLLLAAVLAAGDFTGQPRRGARLVLAAAVLLALQPFDPSFLARGTRYLAWAGLVLASLLAGGLLARPRALLAVALGAVVAGTWCVQRSLATGGLPGLPLPFVIDAPALDAPARLGERFGRQSHPDALVLVPPTSEVWSFKLYARRGVVVDDKGTPFTDRGMREWQDRMSAVLGEPLTPATDAAAAWRGRAPEAIAATARRYGARYILTRDADHPVLPGEVIDREAGWSLWMLPR